MAIGGRKKLSDGKDAGGEDAEPLRVKSNMVGCTLNVDYLI